MWFASIIGVFSIGVHLVSGFYLPGLSPVNYCSVKNYRNCKTNIPVWVNRLDSIDSLLPFDYSRFNLCPADYSAETYTENLGQVVFGERIHPSPYSFTFNKSETCKKVCEIQYNSRNEYDKDHYEFLLDKIKLNYNHHWIVDNLPMIFCYQVQSEDSTSGPVNYCTPGFPLGCYRSNGYAESMCDLHVRYSDEDTYYIFNHLDIEVIYHPGSLETWGHALSPELVEKSGRIVYVKVTPASMQHEDGKCNYDKPMSLKSAMKDGTTTITYTYSVTYTPSSTVRWASRWDYILGSIPQASNQWFSILNSLVFVLIMSGFVATILARTVRRDISRYNQGSSEDHAVQFSRWKLIQGEVFRPPRFGVLLSAFLGCGVQLFFMTVITIVLACLGILSPANRGFLMTCVLVCYILLGTASGYSSARIYKMFGGEKRKLNVLLTAFLVPGIIFAAFFFLNLILWSQGSSAAMPFSTLIDLLGLWFGVCAPLTYFGAHHGFKRQPIKNPVPTNQVSRQVPHQVGFNRLMPSVVMGGVLPFGCIFLQLYFILNSIWSHQIYYMFGFLLLAFAVLAITCCEVTILLCYRHLCTEDYHWWWRSFFTSGFTAVYMFLYSIHYFIYKLQLSGFINTILYFGYTAMFVFLFFLLTGCIGFFACFWFVRKIYSVVEPQVQQSEYKLPLEEESKHNAHAVAEHVSQPFVVTTDMKKFEMSCELVCVAESAVEAKENTETAVFSSAIKVSSSETAASNKPKSLQQ